MQDCRIVLVRHPARQEDGTGVLCRLERRHMKASDRLDPLAKCRHFHSSSWQQMSNNRHLHGYALVMMGLAVLQEMLLPQNCGEHALVDRWLIQIPKELVAKRVKRPIACPLPLIWMPIKYIHGHGQLEVYGKG
jgi:hypothetical protein